MKYNNDLDKLLKTEFPKLERNTSSKFKIAYDFDKSISTKQNAFNLVDSLRVRAESGHAYSIYLLAQCLLNGYGVQSSDLEKGIECAEKAGLLGFGPSYFYLGYNFSRGSDWAQVDMKLALKYFMLGSELRDQMCSLHLGYMHESGRGVVRDLHKAHDYFVSASNQGSFAAYYSLGMMAYNGSIAPEDPKKAFSYFETAASRGNKRAKYMIGKCYLEGYTVEKNVAAAIYWLNESYSDYSKMAAFKLGCIYLMDKYRNTGLAITWLKRAYEDGYDNMSSSYKLGMLYKNDLSDLPNALHWLRLSAAAGHVDATLNVEIVEYFYTKSLADRGLNEDEIHAAVKNPLSNSTEFPETDPATDLSAINKLNEMVGLGSVKERVSGLVNEITLRNERIKRGIKTGEARSYHMVFSGNPGTGKTVVARQIAKIFYDLGVCKENKFVETDRSGLVADFVGQTASKTNAVIDEALGGVLFIDEAYSLRGEGKDFGKEALEALLKRMEDCRDNLIVIAAGYTKEMESLMDMNPGLKSRFTRVINFEDYNGQDLIEIFKMFAASNGYIVSDEVCSDLSGYFDQLRVQQGTNFANAREARNVFEGVIQYQETRICGVSNVTELSDSELMEITAEDIESYISLYSAA